MNKIEHLNFSRQLAIQAQRMLEIPSLHKDRRSIYSHVVDLHKISTKFILPRGGRLFDDKQFKALDEKEELHLPFPFIALEYEASNVHRDKDDPVGFAASEIGRDAELNPIYEDDSFVDAPKRICFARERDGWIVITIAFFTKQDGLWRVLPECALPNTGYLNRDKTLPNGRVMILAKFENDDIRIRGDYMDELGALLCFLNALQCSNVETTRSDPKKSKAKLKNALPFDSYHILTIDRPHGSTEKSVFVGNRRASREHLRRGHIRRLLDGRKIWVNAAVINAGKNFNKVEKDYRVAA
jgi:hypothetical protein